MSIEALLKTYNKAFIAGDLDAAVACYASPCAFVSERPGGPVVAAADPEASRAPVSQILDWNRRIGVARLRSELRWRLDLSEQQSCWHLHIVAEDESDAALYEFDGVYTFIVSEGEWRIAAISHNQIPALLARLRAAAVGTR